MSEYRTNEPLWMSFNSSSSNLWFNAQGDEYRNLGRGKSREKRKEVITFSPINDASINNAVRRAQKLGWRGTSGDIKSAMARLIGPDGKPSPQKGILRCSDCGGGFGLCGKDACIGLTCCPLKGTITIKF